MTFGLPYASPVIDIDGYGVECPICQHVCRGRDPRQATAEDDVTKGAMQAYQLHYAEEHTAVVEEVEICDCTNEELERGRRCSLPICPNR
jgi:hypothetical protein